MNGHACVATRVYVGVVGDVAADERAPQLVRGLQHYEAAGRRIDDKITGLGDGADEAPC